MQLFAISYTKSINRRFNRVGALFQGAFQSKVIDDDEHLAHLSRYIHLNPVRAGLVRQAQEWPFSSYREYVGLRKGTLPMTDLVLEQFIVRPMPQAQTKNSEPSETSQFCSEKLWTDARVRYRRFVEAYNPDNRNSIAHFLF